MPLPEFFVVDQGPSGHDQGRRFRIEADGSGRIEAHWDGPDREHIFLLGGPPEEQGDAVAIDTEFGRWRLRPAGAGDRSWLGLPADASLAAVEGALRGAWAWPG